MGRLIDQYQIAVRVIGMHAEGKTIRRALQELRESEGCTMTRQGFEAVCARDENLRVLRINAARCFRDQFHDLLLNIDDDPEAGRSDPKMAAVVSANIKHVLAVDDPERFGNKLKVEHNITASEAIVRALEAGRKRAGLTAPVIDLVAETVEEELGAAAGEKVPLPPPPLASTTPSAANDPMQALMLLAAGGSV